MEVEEISPDEGQKETQSGMKKKGRKVQKNGEGSQPSIKSMFAKM